MRIADGEVKNMPKEGKSTCSFPDVEIFGNRWYVVLPPSLHPAGTFYQWVPGCPGEPLRDLSPGEPPPLVRQADLDWLGVALAKKTRKNWESPDLVDGIQWTAFLSRNNRRILNSILVNGSRNTSLTKPTYDVAALINEGRVDYSEGLELLISAADRCGYPRKKIKQMLRSAMQKPGLTPASKYYEIHRNQPERPWQKALTVALSYEWKGNTAQSDRAVFLACIKRARQDDSDIFRCSEREIAELTPCSRKTARAALRRLRGDIAYKKTPTLLSYIGRDKKSGAAIYRFADITDTPSTCTPLTLLDVSGGVSLEGIKSVTSAEKDMFGRQKVAWRVWLHLCRQ